MHIITRNDHVHDGPAADAYIFAVSLPGCHANLESAKRQTAPTAEQIKTAVPADEIVRIAVRYSPHT